MHINNNINKITIYKKTIMQITLKVNKRKSNLKL